MDLATLLETVPPTVIGFIIGSIITVIGVVLTNAANTKRLRIQHEHDREMRNRDRDLNLRRDIYLAAMEAISTGIVVVTRFGDLDVPGQDLMLAYTNRSPAIGKVSIVGTGETIKAVATFNQELTGAFLRLTSLREGVEASYRRSEELEAEIQQISREQEQRAARIAELESADPPDEESLHTLRAAYETDQARLEALHTENAALSNQVFQATMELTRKSLTEVETLDSLVVPIISAMRSELGLPFDAALYRRIAEESHRKVAEHLEVVIGDLAHVYQTDEDE